MTKKAILHTLVSIEKEHKWLTADAIHDQEDLFSIQEQIALLMVELANDTQTDITREIPYLFTAK